MKASPAALGPPSTRPIEPSRFTGAEVRRLMTKARGFHRPGVMNSLEAEYAALLEIRRRTDTDVAWYAFEAVTLKLAKDLRYTPDFLVMRMDGMLECHETKGYWQDDALAKIKMAAEKFPFRFMAIQKLPKKDGGGWTVREF
jgi:hypothetical protein